MNEKTLGQVAFEAYNDAKGGKTYDGKPIPPWSEVPDASGVKQAWEAAVHAVTSHGTRSIEDLATEAQELIDSTQLSGDELRDYLVLWIGECARDGDLAARTEGATS